jgi:pPIWI_RE module N-terminal domain/RNaseH domain of pPIWI_RE/MID domain of pPIWI_RE
VYTSIRLTAYEPDPAAGGWSEQYHVIPFDEAWRTILEEVYQLGRQGRNGLTSLPLRQLNGLFRSVAPGVMVTGRGAGADATMPWIYARNQVPDDVVRPVVSSWIMGFRVPEEHLPRLLDARHAVSESMPAWSTTRIDLTTVGSSPDGTADPDRRLFSLVPEILAARLAVRPLRLPGVGRDLRFRVVDRDHGAELVSWPPQEFRDKGCTWYYSAVLTITVQTAPFTCPYRVHVSSGIRRWTTSMVDLSHHQSAGVLLDVPLPWPGLAEARRARLIANRVGWDRELKRIGWRGRSVAGLLPNLDIIRTYPRADELVAEPRAWLRGRGGLAAGIVHQNRYGVHGVETGLLSGERSLIDEWVADGLRPMFRRVPDLQRVREANKPALIRKPSARSDPPGHAEALRTIVSVRRATLKAGLFGEPLDVDVLWQFRETRDALLGSLAELLGFPHDPVSDEPNQEWQFGGLRIRILTSELGGLGTPLDVSRRTGVTRSAALSEAVHARRAAVAARLSRRLGRPGLAIVEIGGESRFTAQDSDPKFALRLGLADSGRLSQFITVPADAAAEIAMRAPAAWLDGLRQIGAITIPRPRVAAEVPADLQYLALWVVRRRADGPTRRAGQRLIALRIRLGDDHDRICGWDHERREWISYPALLLRLAQGVESVEADDPESQAQESRDFTAEDQRQEIERQIRVILYQERRRPTLLMANAGNLRGSWTWLRNATLAVDRLGFAGEDAQRLAVYGSDLRFILTRDGAGRDETPQWYAPAGDDAVAGLASGLWTSPEAVAENRLFASVTDKPANAGKIHKGVMKLGPHPSWPKGPSVVGRNPRYLELVLVGCLSAKALADAGVEDRTPDIPATWAAIAHQLRSHDDYAPLARPLPLHLAKLAEEYVLPIAVDFSTD